MTEAMILNMIILVRDQKAAGSNPATSTPRDIVNQCSRGFAFPAGFPLSSGLQLSRLQQGGEARISASKKQLPYIAAFFRYKNGHFDISRFNS